MCVESLSVGVIIIAAVMISQNVNFFCFHFLRCLATAFCGFISFVASFSDDYVTLIQFLHVNLCLCGFTTVFFPFVFMFL